MQQNRLHRSRNSYVDALNNVTKYPYMSMERLVSPTQPQISPSSGMQAFGRGRYDQGYPNRPMGYHPPAFEGYTDRSTAYLSELQGPPRGGPVSQHEPGDRSYQSPTTATASMGPSWAQVTDMTETSSHQSPVGRQQGSALESMPPSFNPEFSAQYYHAFGHYPVPTSAIEQTSKLVQTFPTAPVRPTRAPETLLTGSNASAAAQRVRRRSQAASVITPTALSAAPHTSMATESSFQTRPARGPPSLEVPQGPPPGLFAISPLNTRMPTSSAFPQTRPPLTPSRTIVSRSVWGDEVVDEIREQEREKQSEVSWRGAFSELQPRQATE